MSYLDSLQTGVKLVPRRTLIYGQHGVGKTTWASRWPAPVLLPTEDGYHHVDVASGKKLESATELWQAIKDVSESAFKTVIVDSIDWTEMLIQSHLDDSGFDQSWGKGQLEVAKRMRKILTALDECRDKGKHVVLVGHAEAKPVERPDGLSYQTYAVKLGKHCCRVVSEWCDEMLFCQRDYLVRQQDNGKHGVGVDKGTRSIYTTGTPSFEAKNRIPGLPEKFDLNDIDGYLSYAIGKDAKAAK